MGRRRVLHFNVTGHPSARWVIQQLRDAFPETPAHRYLVLDYVVVLGEDHLRRLLRDYVEHYNVERVHTSIGDAPAGRARETRSPDSAKVVGLPRVGGLHHRYAWRDAA